MEEGEDHDLCRLAERARAIDFSTLTLRWLKYERGSLRRGGTHTYIVQTAQVMTFES